MARTRFTTLIYLFRCKLGKIDDHFRYVSKIRKEHTEWALATDNTHTLNQDNENPKRTCTNLCALKTATYKNLPATTDAEEIFESEMWFALCIEFLLLAQPKTIIFYFIAFAFQVCLWVLEVFFSFWIGETANDNAWNKHRRRSNICCCSLWLLPFLSCREFDPIQHTIGGRFFFVVVRCIVCSWSMHNKRRLSCKGHDEIQDNFSPNK